MSNIKDLKFDNKNFNDHTEFGMSLLEKSLQDYGAGRSILIDKNNNIIAGNGIVEAAAQAGIENVRIIETQGDELVAVKRTDVDLNTQKGREMAFADNATASVDLSWNKDNIGEFFTPEDTEKWGIDLDWEKEQEIQEDEAPEVNESEPAKSELGKVYHLGEHRLMCGDSTDDANVDILMNGQKADLLFTDPPYNVNVSNSQGMTIENDNMSEKAFADFINKAFSCASKSLKPGASFYIWYADSEDITFRLGCINNQLLIKQCLIWVKNSFNFGRQDYKWQHEPCLYGWKDGAGHYFVDEYNHPTVIEDKLDIEKLTKAELKNILIQIYASNIKTTVIHENKPLKNDLHPTMKPLKMCADLIQNSSVQGHIVLDLFGGSGSTLIVCEQINRSCYMMEYDPKYCDVIRKRYWKFKTGSEEGWEEGTI